MKLYYPDSRVTVRQFFSLFLWSKYGINCQKKWYQPVVSVLNSMHVSFLMFSFSGVCFFIYVGQL